MKQNLGKKFEEKFKNDWLKIPNSSIDRLYDTMNGYKTISQVSDFIGYVFPNIFYLECKSINGNTFPITNLTQYSKLVKKVGIKGVRVGVIIWYKEHERVSYVPISTLTEMIKDGKKSVNIKEIDNYRIVEIPSKVRRTFLDSDYSVLLDLEEGE